MKETLPQKYSDIRVLLAGGDLRSARLAGLLAEKGFTVDLLALSSPALEGMVRVLDEETFFSQRTRQAYDLLVLPLPAADSAGRLNAPLGNGGQHTVSEILDRLLKTCLITGGRLTDALYSEAASRGMDIVDYFEREELVVANCVPTVEGALQLAYENMTITLHGSSCLVVGYGRVGKVLAHYLSAAGAKVTVSARKAADFAWIDAFGYRKADTRELGRLIGEMDAVFNTVPSMVIDRSLLEKTKKGAVIVDLASKPGGVDFAAAKELGVNVIWALSLPGKVAPDSAGRIIYDTVMNIINERSGG